MHYCHARLPHAQFPHRWAVQVADFNLSKLVEGTESSNSKTGTMAGANPKWLVRLLRCWRERLNSWL